MRVIADRDVPAVLADPAKFTGRVWRSDYISPDDPERLSGARFVYESGSRSHWHMHEREQAIVVVYGRGLVSWEGLDEPIRLTTGDWWHVAPGVAHWHGAVPDAPFAHLAVTAGGRTRWLHEVALSEYQPVPGERGSGWF